MYLFIISTILSQKTLAYAPRRAAAVGDGPKRQERRGRHTVRIERGGRRLPFAAEFSALRSSTAMSLKHDASAEWSEAERTGGQRIVSAIDGGVSQKALAAVIRGRGADGCCLADCVWLEKTALRITDWKV